VASTNRAAPNVSPSSVVISGCRIGHQLPPGVTQDCAGRASVLSEETVRMLGKTVAWLAGVDHQHLASRPRHLDCGGQTGKAAADDGKIILHDWKLQ
jgi:hypothetical protein